MFVELHEEVIIKDLEEIERNRGKVYCTIRGMCEGPCRDENLRRYDRTCSEAYYLTTEGEVAARA